MISKKIKIIKLGGEVIEDAKKLSTFLQLFVDAPGHKVLVHGGGKIATSVAQQRGVEVKIIEGRRITNQKMRNVAQGVYGGLVNKNIVAKLQSLGCMALGLTGADLGVLKAQRRGIFHGIDYGYVGEIDSVESGILIKLLEMGITPVLAPLSWNSEIGLLNTCGGS